MAYAFDKPLPLSDRLAVEFSSLVLPGRSPFASGTCGAAVATLLAPWLFFPLSPTSRILLILLLFFAGGLAGSRVEALCGKKDPGLVIIDEVMGQWITFLPFATLSPLAMVIGFLLFRFFDILKPWPVRSSETWLPGGYGIMIDDGLAGIYGMISLALLHNIFSWL